MKKTKKEREAAKRRKERREKRKEKGKGKEVGKKKKVTSPKSGEVLMGFCVKCKKKREMVNPKEFKTKNGMIMAKGNCVECDCRMCKILRKA